MTPLFQGSLWPVLLIISLEFVISRKKSLPNAYEFKDTMSNLGTGVLFLSIGLVKYGYTQFFYDFFLMNNPFNLEGSFSSNIIFSIILWEFCYYWQHRTYHTIPFLWMAHSTHHSSHCFNFLTTVRRSSFAFIFNWIFFIPMALMGIPYETFLWCAGMSVGWGFLTHTQFFPQFGVIEKWILVGPSTHRVHHGKNKIYHNKNFGSMLIIWDQIFGTYQKELKEIPIQYGIKEYSNEYNPIFLNLRLFLGKKGNTKLNSTPLPLKKKIIVTFSIIIISGVGFALVPLGNRFQWNMGVKLLSFTLVLFLVHQIGNALNSASKSHQH